MSNVHTIINLRDKNNLKDKLEAMMEYSKKPVSFLRGHVTMIDDETGETILDKDNLIVLRGRTFALEKMFGVPNNLDGVDYNSNNLAKKTICLFRAGRGGCVEGQPFNVLPSIDPDCRELGEPIPFRIKLYENEEKPEGYYDLKEINFSNDDGNTVAGNYKGYYAKTFESITWGRNEKVYSDDDDEVYVKLTLKIDAEDFKTIPVRDENNNVTLTRNTFLNEIGLCIANHVSTSLTDKMEDIELVTRINFQSEPYMNQTKTSTLYYYIYA